MLLEDSFRRKGNKQEIVLPIDAVYGIAMRERLNDQRLRRSVQDSKTREL